MAGLPPPPSRGNPGDYAFLQWQQDLYNYLVTAGSINWANINFAGSNLNDLATKNHSSLTSVLGNGSYHLSATEQSRVAGVISKAGDPTTSDIAASTWAIYKNTSTGAVKLWTNDAGTMKGVALV